MEKKGHIMSCWYLFQMLNHIRIYRAYHHLCAITKVWNVTHWFNISLNSFMKGHFIHMIFITNYFHNEPLVLALPPAGLLRTVIHHLQIHTSIFHNHWIHLRMVFSIVFKYVFIKPFASKVLLNCPVSNTSSELRKKNLDRALYRQKILRNTISLVFVSGFSFLYS